MNFGKKLVQQCRSLVVLMVVAWALGAGAMHVARAEVSIKPGVWSAIDVKKDGGPLDYGKHLRMIYRPVDKKIYLVGGDYSLAGAPHVQSGRQEFWKYDPASGAPVMEMIDPYCVPKGVSQPERPDESPVAYDSKRDRYYIAAGSWVDNPCDSTTIDKTWGYYDFAAQKWIDTGVQHHRGQSKWAVYDSGTDLIYMFLWDGGRGLGVQTFSPGTNKQEKWWIAYDDNGKYMNSEVLAASQMALDEKNRAIYVIAHNTGTLWRYNLDHDNHQTGKQRRNPAFTRLLQDPRLKQKNYSASMTVWDSAHDVLIVMMNQGARGDFDPYVFNPRDNSLSAISKNTFPAGLFPQGNSAIYVPGLDAVLAFCASFTDEPGSVPHQHKAFYYRYADTNVVSSSDPETAKRATGERMFGEPAVERFQFASVAGISDVGTGRLPVEGSFARITPEPTPRLLPVFKDPQATQALGRQDVVMRAEPFPRYWGYPVFAERKGVGYVFWFGGGHSDYPGNDVEIYSTSTNRWSQTRHPQVPEADDPVYGAGGSPNVFVAQAKTAGASPGEWQPYVIHGYGRQSYDPSTDRYVITATGCARVVEAAGKFTCAQKRFGALGFDPNGKRWEMLTGAEWALAGQADLTQFDPGLGGVVAYYSERGGNGTEAALIKNGKLVRLPRIRENISEGGAHHGGNASIYVSSIQSHLVAVLPQGGRIPFALWRVDFASGSAHRVSVPADVVALIGKHGNWKMAFDTERKKVLIMQAGADQKPRMRWFDPKSEQWSDWFTARDAPSIDPDTAYSGRQLLMYNSADHDFLLLRPNGSWRNGHAELWRLDLSSKALPSSNPESLH